MAIGDVFEQSRLLARVRDQARAVEQARVTLAAAISARDIDLARARDAGASWSALREAGSMRQSGVRDAIARARTRADRTAGLPLWLAIDSPRTRVRDDAFRVQIIEGCYRVEVCSPAVSDVVPAGSVDDRTAEALTALQGTSVRRIGILPRRVELDWSLGEEFSGSALAVAMKFTGSGQAIPDIELRRTPISRGQIRTMTPDEAGRILTGAATCDAVQESLTAAHELARRMSCAVSGTLSPEMIVQILTTAANTAAAIWAREHGIPLLSLNSEPTQTSTGSSDERVRITNPLRRYSSLANQRALLSAVDCEQLAETGVKHSPRPTSIQLADLPTTQWEELLRSEFASGQVSAAVARAFRKRCTAGAVRWQDVDLLLDAGAEWHGIVTETVAWIRAERPDVVHELLKANAQRAEATVYFEFARPESTVRTAACACRVLLNGYATKWIVADAEPWMDRPVVQTRKSVRHQAAWAGMEALLGHEDYTDITLDPEFPATMSDLGNDGPPTAFWRLFRYARDSGQPMAAFKVEPLDPETASPQFVCTASMSGLAARGEGFRPGAAKADAALALLHLVRSEFPCAVTTRTFEIDQHVGDPRSVSTDETVLPGVAVTRTA